MDKLDKRLRKKVLESISESDSVNVIEFNKKSLMAQRTILNLVYTAQAESMRRGIEQKKIISLPTIGVFKIKDTRLKSIEFSQEILEEFGVKHKSQLSKEQLKEHNDRMAILMRNEIMSKKRNKNIED